jgi:hypothetical protein
VLIILLLIFIADFILKIIVNPASLLNEPTSDSTIEIVDKTSTRSIAIFSIVLVVIQFSLPSTAGVSLSYWESLSVGVLTLSAGFLTISFIMELWGSVLIFAFNLQITSLRYAGLLLFLGMCFLLQSYSIPETTTTIFALFVVLSWILWIMNEIDYLSTQKDEWDNNKRDSKRECLKEAIKKGYSELNPIS